MAVTQNEGKYREQGNELNKHLSHVQLDVVVCDVPHLVINNPNNFLEAVLSDQGVVKNHLTRASKSSYKRIRVR